MLYRGISYVFFLFYSFISYVFLLYFTVLLKQLRRLYTGGFIFRVPPVPDYITWCTNAYLHIQCTSLSFTRSMHQPLLTRRCMTNQGEAHQYIDHVVCFIQKTIIIQPNKTTITTLRDISLRSCVPTALLFFLFTPYAYLRLE